MKTTRLGTWIRVGAVFSALTGLAFAVTLPELPPASDNGEIAPSERGWRKAPEEGGGKEKVIPEQDERDALADLKEPLNERTIPEVIVEPAPVKGKPMPEAKDKAVSVADRAVAGRVRGALVADKGSAQAARGIKVSSRGGVVTLKGRVATEEEKAAIVAIASKAVGGEKIVNKITVKPPKTK